MNLHDCRIDSVDRISLLLQLLDKGKFGGQGINEIPWIIVSLDHFSLLSVIEFVLLLKQLVWFRKNDHIFVWRKNVHQFW